MVKPSRGRPRSQAKHEAILKATASLLRTSGFDGLTMEGIAAEAKSSKQTLYRWWGSKTELVLETIASGYLAMSVPMPENSGDLRNDLNRWILSIFGTIDDAEAGPLVPEILAAVAVSGVHSQKLYELLIQPIRHALKQRFLQQEQGHPDSLNASPEFLAEVVAGSLLVRFIFGEPTTKSWVTELLDLVSPQERTH